MVHNRRIPQFACLLLALLLGLTAVLFLTIAATQAAPLPDAPWNPNVKVNDDAIGVSDQWTPALAASKTTGDVYAIWADDRNGDQDIYFARSTDSGFTWGMVSRVNHDSGGAWQSMPDIALNATGALHTVWVDSRDGGNNIYYARSLDGGQTWSAEIRVNDVLTSSASSPAIAVLTDTVCIVWSDYRNSYLKQDLYIDCSTNGGVTWGSDARVNNDAAGVYNHYNPDIVVGPGDIGAAYKAHVVWYDYRNGTTNADIYYGYFSAAAGWVNRKLNDDATAMAQFNPSIAIAGQNLYVVWEDRRNDGVDIFSSTSSDGGQNWSANQQVNMAVGDADSPEVTVTGQGTAWSTWRVYTAGEYIIYAGSYGPNGWGMGNAVVTQSTTYKQAPVIAAGWSYVQVGWEHHPQDDNDVDLLVSVWNGSAWQPAVQVDDQGDAGQQYPAIARGSTGRLYTAWADSRAGGYGPALYADRSSDNGATWNTDVRVDDEHSIGGAPSLAAAGIQNVHVVWASMSQDYGAIYYDRSADGGLTWGVDRRLNEQNYMSASDPDIVVSGTQQLFVVWAETGQLVMAQSNDGGTSWLSPTHILSSAVGSLSTPALAVGPDGVLHLAWAETAYLQAFEYHIGYARSLDGGKTWVDRQFVDSWADSTAARGNPDIAVDPNGSYVHLVWNDEVHRIPQIYHAASDDDGVSWGTPGRLSSGDAEAVAPAVAVDSDSVVYVVWQDALYDADDIFYSVSANFGVTWSMYSRVNDDDSAWPQRHPAIVGGGSAYAVWDDFRNVNWDIYASGLQLVCSIPMNGVKISGSSTTTVGIPVTLQAQVSPSNASPPLNFVWSPQPASGQGTDVVRYYWQKPGTYNIQLVASNCGGEPFTATHRIMVSSPPPILPCVEGQVYYATTVVPGVQVELIAGSSASGSVLQTTTTNSSGGYRFCNVAPGAYMLKRYGPTPEYVDWAADSLTMGGSNVIKNLDLPKKMTLLTPANGATINTTVPTMTWQALPEADRYTFQLNKTADWTLVEHTNNIVGAAHRVLEPLNWLTGYTWQIDAYAGTHWVGSTATPFTFTTPISVVIELPPFVEIKSSLRLEEAAEGVIVNKLIGDDSGKTDLNYVDVVAYVSTSLAEAASNVETILTVPGNVLGAPANTWVRDTYGGALTPATSVSLGGGQYKVTTNLTRGCFWWFCPYRRQVVWRFRIPNTLTPQTLNLQSRVQRTGYWVYNSFSTAKLRLVSTAGALIVTNRTQLYDNYTASEVTSLLAQLYNVAQGAPHNDQPLGVVYNADLYDNDVRDWNNTTVNYASEATANTVANELDALINDWVEDGTWTWSYHYLFSTTISVDIYPYYLLLVGDDDVLPFYRYNDPFNDENGWTVTSATNPQIRATDNDYILSDAPYADLWGGTDWQTGDLELAVGRLLGATADDMRYLLNNSLATDGGTWRAVMASVDGWELGYNNPGCGSDSVADVLNVPARLVARGFNVRNDSETPHTVDVMSPFDASWITGFRNAANAGMDIFFIGGHNSYNSASIPENNFTPDDTCSGGTCGYNRFDNDHPLTFIVGCHGGLPVPNIGGRGGIDDNMVYDVVHEGGRAYIGATGYSYGSPGSLCHASWGEKLLQHFFDEFLKSGTESRTIGDALRRAKAVYPFGQYNPGTSATDGDALDRKTVTEFNLYGVPWQRLDYPGGMSAVSGQPSAIGRQPSAVRVDVGNIVQADTYRYTRTITVDIAGYSTTQVITGGVTYDVLSIVGGDMAVAPNLPMLPYVKGYTLTLPISATVQSVTLADSTCGDETPREVPIIVAQPWSEGGTTFTMTTDINTLYPALDDLVVGQMQNRQMLLTLFPIQHNPTTNQTRFCSQMVVEIVYDAPVALAVSHVTPLAATLTPGAPISVTALLENVTDELLTVTSTLTLLDAEGNEMGWQDGGPFSIPADGHQLIEVGWSGTLPEGVYGLRLALWQEDMLRGLATTRVSVVGGALTALEVPTVTLAMSDTATFRVTFANYLAESVTATAHLRFYDNKGEMAAILPSQTVTEVNGEHVFTFTWEVGASAGGVYEAQALVVREDETQYGPLTDEFMVGSVLRKVFLPVVLRNF